MPKQNKADLPSSTEEDVYVFTLLEKMGCSGKEAVAFTKSLFNMLSTPILEQIKSSHMQLEAKMDAQNSSLEAKMDGLDAQNSNLEAKMDAQNSNLEAKMDAQNSRLKAEMSHLRWFIGIVFAVLGGVLATVVALVAG